MARPDSELVLDAATGRLRPARHLPAAAAAAVPAPVETPTNPALLLIFLIAILTPATFNVAGLALPPYRLILMAMIVPYTLKFLSDKEQPVNAVDVLMIAYIFWVALATLVNAGTSRIVFIGSTTIDQFGAYLMGRAIVRNATDFRLFLKYFFGALLFLLPFALLETVTRIFPIHQLVSLIAAPTAVSGGQVRMGLFRAQTVFPHPILFGLFCSIAIANFYYLYRDRFLLRWFSVGVVTLITLTSLSTAPLIGMAVQFGAIVWDRLTRGLVGRWILLGLLCALAVAIVEAMVPGGLLGFIVEEVAYSEVSGRGRLEILEYGGAEVARNPVFGIGFAEWVRPWWRKSSVDNFYLATAMRYGLPSLIFLIGAILMHMLFVARSFAWGDGHNDLRLGYLISLSALLVMIASVALWGALPVFVLTLIGAGSWFYSSGPESGRPRRRSAPTSASAAASVPGGLPAPAPAPRPSLAEPARPRPVGSARARSATREKRVSR